MKYILLILSALLFLNCRKQETLPFTSKNERFLQVYAELQKLRKNIPPQYPTFLDSARTILQKYNFTKEEYERILSYLNEKPERWEAFYQEVLERLKKEETPLSQNP